MSKTELFNSLIQDLGANYKGDDEVLSALLDDVIGDALFVSNRDQLVKDSETMDEQIGILSSNIRRAVKTIYLQRGSEDVKSQSLAGLSSGYDEVFETLKNGIIRNGKRIVR